MLFACWFVSDNVLFACWFDDLVLSFVAELLQEITKQGFERPTPIQCQVWPLALQGHDVIGIAQVREEGKYLIICILQYVDATLFPTIKLTSYALQ